MLGSIKVNNLKTDIKDIKTNIEQLTTSVKNSYIQMGDELKIALSTITKHSQK